MRPSIFHHAAVLAALAADAPLFRTIAGPQDFVPDSGRLGGAPAPQKVPGRNDDCPCGSGRKYKRCCQNNPESEFRDRRHF